jgi:hypothetical protein
VDKKRKKLKDENLKRKNKRAINFNNHEVVVLDKYFKKYKVNNRSQFMREIIMTAVLKKFSDDYPTLWDQPGLSLQPTLSF